MILDSSILIAFERRRFDLERLLTDYSPPAIAAMPAAELLIGVERADTPERLWLKGNEDAAGYRY